MRFGRVRSWCKPLCIPLGAILIFSADLRAVEKNEKSPKGEKTPPGLRLGYEETIQKALATSSQRKIAESDYDAQVAKKRQAWAGIGPKVTAGYTELKFDKKINETIPLAIPPSLGGTGEPIMFPVRDDKMRTASITVAQPIVSLYPLIQYARFEGVNADLKQTTLKIIEREVAYGSAVGYRRAQQAAEMVDIARASIKAAENQSKDAKALFSAGKLTKGDLLKVEMALLDAKAQLAKAEAGRDVAFSSLSEALGLPHDSFLVLDKISRAPKPGPLGDQPRNDLVDKAVRTRLEMTAANHGASLADFGKSLAYAKFTPQVNVFAKWEKDYYNLVPEARNTRTYGVQATWDIWSNGQSFFEVYEASAGQLKAEESKHEQEQKIRLEVYQALSNLKAAKEMVVLAQGVLEQAEEAYRIETARFRSGATTTTDLLLSENAQTKARGGLVAALTELDIQYLNLGKAVGFESPLSK